MVVPEMGLEPTLAEANTALNRARLPIPPLRHRNERRVYQRSAAPSSAGMASGRGRVYFEPSMSDDFPLVPPPLPPASTGATTALVLGIIGLAGNLMSCCCCLGLVPGLCAPIAWWMGARELRAIRAGLASPAGEGNARTGMICGIAGTAIFALYAVIMIGYVAVVGIAAAAEALKQGHIPVG